jgi:DNA-binding winged helix-turn-helix (wHTH) protein
LTNVSAKKLEFNDWIKFLKANRIILILVIPEAEKYLNPEGKISLSAISYIAEKFNPHIRVISMFESDITHTLNLPFLPASAELYENIFYYPLYNEAETMTFINMISHQWHITISPKIKSQIITQCGGHFWLIKEALREIAGTGTWNPKNTDMIFRLRLMFNLMLPSEQKLITKVVSGEHGWTPDEQISQQYFRKKRLLDYHNHLLIAGFKNFMQTLRRTTVKLTIEDAHILANRIPVDAILSRKEHRILKYFLLHPDTVITREQLAQTIWPVDTKRNYSDWAIDQLIARLRKRITELGLTADTIKTVRGKGYILNVSL